MDEASFMGTCCSWTVYFKCHLWNIKQGQKLSLRSFCPCSLLELKGPRRREISSNLFVRVLYNYFSKIITLFQYLVTSKAFSQVHVTMPFSLSWLTFFSFFYTVYPLQEILLSLKRDITNECINTNLIGSQSD